MKAIRGFTLGLQVLLAASAATSQSDIDGIPEVGIGAVHPICDPLQRECISSDEQVQDEIIAGLQAEDKVTGTANVIELGELLCGSLDEASSSTMLRFAISSEETVTAERTSYSEFDSAAFSDGKERKIWKGQVVDPAPPAGAASRAISMTWTSPCETETFVLKMTTHNLDSTISITTSVPCAAGSSTDICMVQYDVDLPPPAEPLETSRGANRRLTSSTGDDHTSNHARNSAPLSRRNLQSTVEVDVMFLYDEAALERGIASTPEQMETLIADELPASNEAAENSLIDLRFNLVHAGPLPYTVETENHNSEIFNLRINDAVKDLRDQYQADLVVMVGVFPDVCGSAYFNPSTEPSDEIFGYGLVDIFCFDGRVTSHEIGHNMGASHDRVNSRFPTDYGHGLRYCADDGSERFRTIMAYNCRLETQPDESSFSAERVNYFSNPDVDYLGLPTGTSEANNARVLRENMVVVSNFRVGNSGLSCIPGVPGILDNDVCCPTSCGACGGTGCSGRDGGDDFSGSEACCGGGVLALGRICSATVGAPCLVTDDPPAPTPAPVTDDQMCTAGIPGILANDGICCPNSCGSCGGTGCSGRDGGDDFSGSEACCGGGVLGLGRICSATVGAPCIVTEGPPPEDEMCAAGIAGILANDGICCPNSCGSCGGVGCSGRDGGDDFSGSEACCGGGVLALGRVCSATVGAPCLVTEEPPPEDEICAAGIAGILANDGICCPNSCGSCGGTGCSRRDGGDDFSGSEACCGGGVLELGRICSTTVGAPCIVTEGPPPEDEMCAAGIAGILANDGICCPNSCGSCGGTGCSGRDGGDDFSGSEACCGGGVLALGRTCSSSVGAPCVVADTEAETCIAGVPGILARDVCCPTSCGSCGGTGCSGRDGGANFTGSQACCGGGVVGLNRVCSASVGAPCVVVEDSDDDDTPTGDFTCDGVANGDFCCSDGCGECGGSGCSNRGGGLTGNDCCTSDILASGRLCSDTRAAPCFLD